MDTLYALVLAGGRGTRFWPLSREERPKQCIPIGSNEAYLAQTIARLQPIIPLERILIVTGHPMEQAVRAVAPELPEQNILVEPWARNNAPSIGWGAVEIGKRSADAVMAIFPCDHHIQNEKDFQGVVLSAAAAAAATNSIVALGVRPNRPETGYGYLEVGPVTGEWGSHQFRTVDNFVEKPDPATAQTFVGGGRHAWNAGMFVASVAGLRDAYRTHLPRSATALELIALDPSRLKEEWGNLDATSIDYGIMERSRRIMTVLCDFGWSDMGSWSAVGPEMDKISGGRGIVQQSVSIDASNCIVHAPGKVVALLGVDNLVVVDTEDALLVMPTDRAQQVGDLVRLIDESDIDGVT